MHFVAALDRVPGMHCVLCLFEGVATGAADGYGRMAEKPAITLLHGGPGLGNGLANLHNARRAQTPVLNVVGDQATHHRPLDPPLTADTEGWARGLSAWTRIVQSVSTIGADAAAAVQAARAAHGQIATLIAPADTCWDDGGIEGTPLPVSPAGEVAPHVVRQIAQVLRSGEPAVLILGGAPIRATMVADAQRIAAATGAKLTAAQFNARVERGRGRHPIPRLPYGIDQAMAVMAGAQHIVLIGTTPPVAPFAYPDKPGYLAPDAATTHVLARPEQDVADALARLADELGTPDVPAPVHKRLELPTKAEITPENITQMLAALLPENAVVIDESVSFGRNFFNGLSAAAPHDWLQITGGRDRLGPSDGNRCRHRRTGAPRGRTAGGRVGNVYAAGVVDAGARAAADHDGPAVEPQVSNPPRRVDQCRRQCGTRRARHDGPRQSRHRVDQPRTRHGRRGCARHHSERIRRPVRPGQQGQRSVPDRIDDVDRPARERITQALNLTTGQAQPAVSGGTPRPSANWPTGPSTWNSIPVILANRSILAVPIAHPPRSMSVAIR